MKRVSRSKITAGIHLLAGKAVFRTLFLVFGIWLLFCAAHSYNSEAQTRADCHLWFKFCMDGLEDSDGACRDLNLDSQADASANGECISPGGVTGPEISLSEHAFGTCLPAYSVTNEASVSGEEYDPGLDGEWINFDTVFGVVLSHGRGAYHCDSWHDQWTLTNNPC